MGTILDLNELTVPDPLDLMLVREASDLVDRDKKMKIGQLAFKAQTPAAVAGRVARWKDANTLEDSIIATTDLARLSIANNFSLRNTFGGGLTFGQTPVNIFETNTWAIAITAAGGTVVTTPATQSGRYFRIGNSAVAGESLIFYHMEIAITTISGGSGDYRLSLPFPVVGEYWQGTVLFHLLDVAPGVIGVTFECTVGASYGRIRTMFDNAGAGQAQPPGGLQAGTVMRITGAYRA
jgi:hypothetical protein